MIRIFALAAALAATPVLAAPGSDACEGDLAATEIRLREASARLQATRTAPVPQRCAAYRDHVRVMQAASDTFRRCTSGFHARENIAQMQGSIADWREIIGRTCR